MVGSRRSTASGVVAGVLLVLSSAALAVADVGVGHFSVARAAPGDTVQVTLDGCSSQANGVRIALTADGDVHEVAVTDTARTGTFDLVVPNLNAATYQLYAACPKSGPFGFYGAELRVIGTPATSTLPIQQPNRSPFEPAGPFAIVWLLTSAFVFIHRRRIDDVRGRA